MRFPYDDGINASVGCIYVAMKETREIYKTERVCNRKQFKIQIHMELTTH